MLIKFLWGIYYLLKYIRVYFTSEVTTAIAVVRIFAAY